MPLTILVKTLPYSSLYQKIICLMNQVAQQFFFQFREKNTIKIASEFFIQDSSTKHSMDNIFFFTRLSNVGISEQLTNLANNLTAT